MILFHSLLVNGGKSDQFKPSRGLRHGDPLSPYLFIIGQEVLSRLIEKEFELKNINGVKASVCAPPITHVMYADDILLFSKATRSNATAIISCIRKYCLWSGQSLNNMKSGVFFSKQTDWNKRRAIKHVLQMRSLKRDAIYLGSPLFLTKARSKDFKYLVERVESKLVGWRSKSLSWVGRSTLINSVVQTIPNYAMSAFNIPINVCNKLDSLSRRFWWRPKNSEGQFLALTAWDNLCKPKCKGGLGFKRAKMINNALLAKLVWLVATKRDSLCILILRAKYKVRDDWLTKDPAKVASLVWKAIEGVNDIIVKGACYLIGDGSSINVWLDPWIPWIQGFIPKPAQPAFAETPIVVSMLINSTTHCWIENQVCYLFEAEDAKAILSISLAANRKENKLIWVPNAKGVFTTKSAYKVSNPHPNQSSLSDQMWKNIWKIKVLERVRMLLWRIATYTIPVKEVLGQRLELDNQECVLCQDGQETSSHLFFHCPVAKAIWFSSCWGLRALNYNIKSNMDIINLILDPPSPFAYDIDEELISSTMAFVVDEIWYLRNQVNFQYGKIDIQLSKNRICRRALEFSTSAVKEHLSPLPHPLSWSPPPEGSIKFNVDATVSNTLTTLVVVARDHSGTPIKTWIKPYCKCPPAQAEATAVLWAVNLAVAEGWTKVMIEGDSKECFDALSDPGLQPSWVISNFVCDILAFSRAFCSVSFV